MRSPRTRFLLLALICCAAPALAESALDATFGPQTFERTTEDVDLYSETFTAPVAGAYALYVRNGDSESSRVSAATLWINGNPVAQGDDLNSEDPGLRRIVPLEAGENELTVELEGPAGSFVAVAITRHPHVPVFAHGRLLLPWGRNDDGRTLILALKNGSPRAPRTVRVVFFTPDGRVGAVSSRLSLPPHGSLAVPAAELIQEGHWEIGSVEIFFAGPGTARLFGSARQIDRLTDSAEIESLAAAGFEVFRPDSDPRARTSRPRP